MYMSLEHRRAQRCLSVVLALAGLIGCGDDVVGSKSEPVEEPKPSKPTAEAGSGAKAGSSAEAGSGGSATGVAGSSAKPADEMPPPTGAGPCGAGDFDSTFAAIQEVIFERGGCTHSMCHGGGGMSGLDLRADVAYENLIEVKSSNSPLPRVMPGEPDESFLYNKLRAATAPGSVTIEGSPMPSGLPALSREHLEVVRRWIEAGAPREGSVGDSVTGRSDGVAKLLGACVPDATPLEIAPLEAPAAGEGVQIVMAATPLAAQGEIDVCFAQYYDLTDVVPPQFQDPDRGVFFVNGQRTRQDPHSHHLVVSHPGLGAESVNDPAFGPWTCRGGSTDAELCDPLQKAACGTGVCASQLQNKPACVGYGPRGNSGLFGPEATNFTGAQTAQFYQAPREGVYEALPIKGILYMNSHAFNVTDQDTQLHAWINLFYATDPRYELQNRPIANHLSIAAGQAPFTRKTYCADWVAPRNSDLYTLSSHTHKRGRNFTVDLPDGTRIYQSEIYSDPIEKSFDPPLRFDSADPAERTLKYCAEFNNGVQGMRDAPDVDLVTRLSTMPDSTTCVPVACVAGKVGAPCQGESDDSACDATAGSGDGWCDACAITAGQTTENEMFVLSPSYVQR